MIRAKKIVAVIALVLVGGVMGQFARAGATSANATVQARAVPKDGNGVPFLTHSEIGYKVFVTTSVSPTQVLDENGAAPSSGLLHQVCVSSGATTEWAVLYDSAPTSVAPGFTGGAMAANGIYELAPAINRVAASEHCSPFLEAQFNYGLVTYLPVSAGGGTVHVYWRPSRGGSN